MLQLDEKLEQYCMLRFRVPTDEETKSDVEQRTQERVARQAVPIAQKIVQQSAAQNLPS